MVFGYGLFGVKVWFLGPKVWFLGRYSPARRACRLGIELSIRQPYPAPSDVAFFTLALGETLYWPDRIDEARATFRKLLADAQCFNLTHYNLITRASLDLCAIAQGRAPAFSQPETRAKEDRFWNRLQSEEEMPAIRVQVILISRGSSRSIAAQAR